VIEMLETIYEACGVPIQIISNGEIIKEFGHGFTPNPALGI
jgi:hypothetical protein